MARSPGFTLVAVFVLAIGIGMNVAAFSVFNMVSLKPLPVPGADRLVRIERRSPSDYTSEMSYPSFQFYREHAKTLESAIAVLGVPPVQIDDDLQGTSLSYVTPNYFTELGTRPAYGRLFHPRLDGNTGSPPVAVISYRLWQRRFAGDPNVIGQTIHLNKKPVAIVGITPDVLATLGGQYPDIWLPIAQQPYLTTASKTLQNFDESSVRMWGKLAPGVSSKSAEEELRALTGQLRQQHPTAVWDQEFLQVSPGGHLEVMRPEMYQVAAIVGVLALLILIVACGNLGALLLARSVQRQREIGIRLAIGAGAWRIFRQLCTESLMLAILGAVAGLALGCAVTRIALVTLDAPKWLSATPDARVVLFTVAMTFLSAMFFGLTPALQIARQRQRKTVALQILVAAQVAGTCVLLIIAGLLVRAAHHALYTDPGFGYERLISFDPQLARHGYSAAAAKTYLDRIQTELQTTPGVRSVSLVMLPPLGHTVSQGETAINGRKMLIFPNWVTPRFFETMQIPILLGRTFHAGEKHVVIVSDSFARAQWGGLNPIGQLIGDDKVKDVVVGVARDAHVNGLSEDDAVEQYWPATDDQMPSLSLVIRTTGTAGSFPLAAKSISERLDPVLFPEIREIKALYMDNVLGIERIAGVTTLIGIVAALLAAVGLVGLVAFTVRQRTKDIAIRLALGASSTSVLSAILAQFSWPVAIGVVLGTGVAAGGSAILRRALYGISNLDPAGYAGAIIFLFVTLLIAALVPARNALKINVSKALHYD